MLTDSWFLWLQILSIVLDKAAFSFSIKLVAVASKRELIHFDTWLLEKHNNHRGAFYEVRWTLLPSYGLCYLSLNFFTFLCSLQECLKFSREISAVVENVSCAKHQHPCTLGSIYVDAYSTLVKVFLSDSILFLEKVSLALHGVPFML